jgi:hypothetical protein
MCYPVAGVDIEDHSVLYEVLKAAMKYEMKKIIQTLHFKFAHYIERDPLRIYCTSIALGWKEEAIKASKVFALSSDDSANAYVREMEVVPAIAYYRLLKSRYQCRAVANETWDVYNQHSDEWRWNQGGNHLFDSALTRMEENKHMLRIIDDSIAKVLYRFTAYFGCASDC